MKPETLNYRHFSIGGDACYDCRSLVLDSMAEKPNFSKYDLNSGDFVLEVAIDKAQGCNYGMAFLKLRYQEDGIQIIDFDFLNHYDICG